MNLFTQDRPRVIDKRVDFEGQVKIINDTFAAIWRKFDEINKKQSALTATVTKSVTNIINPTSVTAGITSITGTPKQVIATDNLDTTYTLTTPQDTDPTSTPTFNGEILTGQLVSTLPAGTPPIAVANTEECPNLNSELIGGHHITVGTTPPPFPLINDIWIDTN